MHSLLQKFRASRFIEKVIYPNLVKWIYGRHEFPVSDDERKLHQGDIAMIMHYVDNCRLRYFQGLSGRLFPERMTAVAKFDRFLHEKFGLLSPAIAGGVIIQGQFRK